MDLSQRNINPHPKPKEEVMKILRKNMKLDLEFYEFVKQRLARQYKKVIEKQKNIPYKKYWKTKITHKVHE